MRTKNLFSSRLDVYKSKTGDSIVILTQFRISLEEIGNVIVNSVAIVKGVSVALNTKVVAALSILVIFGFDVHFDHGIHWNVVKCQMNDDTYTGLHFRKRR